jgi:hypothetical protein
VASGLGYGKGAVVLQMLEQLMGTPDMIRAMHRWIADSGSGRLANWDGFRRAVAETRPDLHLEDFFSQWLDQPGALDMKAEFTWNSDGGDLTLIGARNVRIPLEVNLQDAAGRWHTQMLDVRSFPYHHHFSGPRPRMVVLDPYLRLLRQIGADEHPVSYGRRGGGGRVIVDAAHAAWAKTWRGTVGPVPTQLDGVTLVGTPETCPEMAPLCQAVGFVVRGHTLTYDGTSIDLNHGAAVAVVSLPSGGTCTIALGETRLAPRIGNARLGLVDDLGRFLRGKTDPKTQGKWVWKLQ